MNNIGLKEIECFDHQPCNPWISKIVCRSCAIKPMKVYNGNTTGKISKFYWDNGIGLLLSIFKKNAHKIAPYYCLDNGCFSSWKNNIDWNPKTFLKLCEEYKNKNPDFVVCPDLVAQGKKSLKFSLSWIGQLRKDYNVRIYLAVQDGMEIKDLNNIIHKFNGVFVGGTKKWKYDTAHKWVEFAHNNMMPCHIGRVYTYNKILWSYRIGADSIDSGAWARNNTFSYVENSKNQERLNIHLVEK